MKLKRISLSDNETQTMLERYRFDEESALKILNDIEKITEELNIIQEQKEYEEMNYQAICKRMAEYSVIELLQQLITCILHR